eukprot:tig00020806_g14041.t1
MSSDTACRVACPLSATIAGSVSGTPSKVKKLPRGGVIVDTVVGAVQIGLPPETIKDSIALGGWDSVPLIYVIPNERFDRRTGVNVAEFDFPLAFNFFLKGRSITLVTTPEVRERARRIMQETMFGPRKEDADMSLDFADSYPQEKRLDFWKEREYLAQDPSNPAATPSFDMLNFVLFDAMGIARLGSDETGILEIRNAWDYFVLTEITPGKPPQEIAQVPGKVELPTPPPELAKEERESAAAGPGARPFSPPAFGVTMLGSSHGFDPAGSTTGFLLWVHGRGIMVDPPMNSTLLLRRAGIAPKLVDAVFISHCHADHDSGAFQKILEESRITVMATPTVMASFLRKYSALSGLNENFLRRLFVYHPVRIGDPVLFHNGELRFFYSFHTVPCVGFEAFYGGKSVVFSADTCNEPERIRDAFAKGVMTGARRDALLDFPWHHTVVLHEAGVPPIHTPFTTFVPLPEDVKRRLYLCHTTEKQVPAGHGLKVAKVGVENTIVIQIDEVPPSSEAVEILDLCSKVDVFNSLSIRHARDIVQAARKVRFAAGERIVRKGDPGNAFWIINAGEVRVSSPDWPPELAKTYCTGDYFGETALILGRPRDADVVAVTDVEVVEFGRYEFLRMLRGTDVIPKLLHLSEMRSAPSWEVLSANRLFRALTSAQKVQLQGAMVRRSYRRGQQIWAHGDEANEALFIASGRFCMRSVLGRADSLEGTYSIAAPLLAAAASSEGVSTAHAAHAAASLAPSSAPLGPGAAAQVPRSFSNRDVLRGFNGASPLSTSPRIQPIQNSPPEPPPSSATSGGSGSGGGGGGGGKAHEDGSTPPPAQGQGQGQGRPRAPSLSISGPGATSEAEAPSAAGSGSGASLSEALMASGRLRRRRESPFYADSLTPHLPGKRRRSIDLTASTMEEEEEWRGRVVSTGAFICDVDAMLQGSESRVLLEALDDACTAFAVPRADFLRFLDTNPGSALALLGVRVLE